MESRQESENQNSVQVRRGAWLRLADGSQVRIRGVQMTPRGLWIKVHPGGWYRASDLGLDLIGTSL